MILFLLFYSLILAQDSHMVPLKDVAQVPMAIDVIDNQESNIQRLDVTFKNFRMRNTGLEKGVLQGKANVWKLLSALAGVFCGIIIGIPLMIVAASIPVLFVVGVLSIGFIAGPFLFWGFFIGGPLLSLGFGTYLIYKESIV